MSTAPNQRRYTLAEYFAREKDSPTKHELYQGEIFAMAGASPRHNRIATNILAQLHRLLEGGPCEVFGSDQRIRIDAADLSTYPDVSVNCGGVQVDKVDRYAATNPRLIVEVLSKSTENYDRGPKFELYQHLESFAEYVVVYQTEPRIIHYTRQDDGTWNYKLLVGDQETLRLHSLEGELPLAAIYRNVAFGPETDDTPETPRPR
jgi:Uma2 family endonuclease